MDRQQELRKQLAEYEEMFEKRKRKRTAKTFFGLCIAFYILGILLGEIGFLEGIIVAPVFATIYMFVSVLVFLPIMTGSTNEAVTIERLKTELRLLEKGQE